ncbi:MAG TPA: hypothetical protein VIC59_11045 [Gemmatimonadota bacterium]|jgi:hypothetical protein
MTAWQFVDVHPPGAARGVRAQRLAPICLALLLAACGEDESLAPPPPRLDTTQLVAFLKDPFVVQLPALLADPAAAEGVKRSLDDLTSVAADGYVTPLRKSFLAMHRSVERYRSDAKPDATDPVILDTLDLVLFQAEGLVGMEGPGEGASAIELR